MGDDVPPDELNRADRPGLHFGFPYLHGRNVQDPKFWKRRGDVEITFPEVEFQAHAAALGMRFYTGTMFPPEYRGGVFVAQHGSWNRSEKVGYQAVFIPFEGNEPGDVAVFASGWLSGDRKQVSGRPVDVEIGLDGSLFVSDDSAHKVYRIWYEEGQR
jgi:glucose/arabinose dehydrogenase